MNTKLKKKALLVLNIFLISLVSFSCDEIFEDTDLNPIYFLECEINGETYRAQTNNNAWMSHFGSTLESEIVINGNINSEGKIFNFNTFPSLGATRVPVGTLVNTYYTDINYFPGNKDYSALEEGGSGYVDFEILTENNAEGTFEATLVNRDDLSDVLEVTNGKFKVKTRN